MRLLLDSHVLVALVEARLDNRLKRAVEAPGAVLHASVASIWELAIKKRLGKLGLATSIAAWPALLQNLGVTLLSVVAPHAVVSIQPEPLTRDPFDRLLLAVCAVEGLQLVTRDRALAGHPLAWQPG